MVQSLNTNLLRKLGGQCPPYAEFARRADTARRPRALRVRRPGNNSEYRDLWHPLARHHSPKPTRLVWPALAVTVGGSWWTCGALR